MTENQSPFYIRSIQDEYKVSYMPYTTQSPPTQKEDMAKVKAPKIKKKPVLCVECRGFTGKYSDPNSKVYTETYCEKCKRSSKDSLAYTELDNELVTKHRAEADEQILDVGAEHLSCERCGAPNRDECSCCVHCHLTSRHAHDGHKYEPIGKNIKAQMIT